MKQKNNKVNSKTGALKQTTSNFQILSRIPMKVMALAILLNFALANLSFGQGDDSIANSVSFAEPVAHSGAHSTCCAEERPVSPNAHKTAVRVSLPSVQMVHRSDREATLNMFRSLHENRVQEMSTLMHVADQAMHAFFVSETSIGRTADVMIHHADEDMNVIFAAEHIASSNVKALRLSDGDINDAFLAENNGLTHGYISTIVSDDDVNGQFALENTTIALPASCEVVKADEEINNNMVVEARGKNTVARSTIRK